MAHCNTSLAQILKLVPRKVPNATFQANRSCWRDGRRPGTGCMTIRCKRRMCRTWRGGEALLRSSPLLALIVVGLLQLAPDSAEAATPSCEPWVVTIEGGWSSSSGDSMKELSQKLMGKVRSNVNVINFDNGYFFRRSFLGIPVLDSHPITRANLTTLVDAMSGFGPIVIIGHSLGGATAHAVSRIIPVSLLVTLDAVSYPDDRPHPGNGTKWINVYAYNHWYGLGNSIGVDWEHESDADENLKLYKTSHSDVIKMFNQASQDIYDALNDCKRRDSRRRSNDEAIRHLCEHNDGVTCSPRNKN